MKVRTIVSALVLVVLCGLSINIIRTVSVSAQTSTSTTITCNDGTTMSVGPSLATSGDACGSHGGTENNPSGSKNDAAGGSGSVGTSGDVETGASGDLDEWINGAINVLSALVGLAIVGSIIFGGIQYQTARDNSSQVSAAKNRIAMAILSLFLYFFAYALLQWLVPGGIF